MDETTPAIELPGNDDLVVRRITTQAVRRATTQAVRTIKGQRPRGANPTVS
ncbi:hypothetical protein [Kribbella capetownensis]|uniref:hypothetical protein n=1 Tax=Kribbella capetownensis TaxID=1572659 RepID=UPI0013F3AA65|nr:hypothetical protein [Kribbella capetownensis]